MSGANAPSPPAGLTSPADAATLVVRRLRDAGHTAYFAGGCVRDELLGLDPQDYDVATDAHPDRVRDVFGRGHTRVVGAAFGVVLVRVGGRQIEVATFRADLDYHDGRRPSGVRFTDAREDAQRRDFTINGLFRDPLVPLRDPGDDGVIDFVGGRRDLGGRVLRAIGNPRDRFAEDYLRLLRAVRFAARFGLTVEAATWEAVVEHAPRLTRISPERVAGELRKMLEPPPPTRGVAWRLLTRSGLLGTIFGELIDVDDPDWTRTPFFDAVSGVDGPVAFPLTLAATLAEVLRAGRGWPAGRILASSAAAEAVRVARRALRVSNDELAATRFILTAGGLATPPTMPNPTVAKLKRFLADPSSPGARVLLGAARYDAAVRPAVDAVLPRLADLDGQEVAPVPLVTGDDLLSAGHTPGRAFKAALEAAYDAQLEGRAATREEAMAVAIGVLRQNAP